MRMTSLATVPAASKRRSHRTLTKRAFSPRPVPKTQNPNCLTACFRTVNDEVRAAGKKTSPRSFGQTDASFRSLRDRLCLLNQEQAKPFRGSKIVASDMFDDLLQIGLTSSRENYSPVHERTA